MPDQLSGRERDPNRQAGDQHRPPSTNLLNMKPQQILCAKCNKPVEKLEWYKDLFENKTVIRVFCHNEIDQMELRFFDMDYKSIKQLETAQGIAFETKQIKSQ